VPHFPFICAEPSPKNRFHKRVEMTNRKPHHESVAAGSILIPATLIGRTKLPEQK
jgi:hypothetical protein